MEKKISGAQEMAASIVAAYNQFGTDKQRDSLSKLYDRFDDLNGALREEIQKDTAEPIKSVIAKLENGFPLAEDEIQFIRLWVIGDAETYLAKENDFDNWLAELSRLLAAVSQAAAQSLDVRSKIALQGVATDALGLIPGIQRYLEAQDRIKRFENSTKNSDPSTSIALREILIRKLKSQND